jgi:hypothetical protein
MFKARPAGPAAAVDQEGPTALEARPGNRRAGVVRAYAHKWRPVGRSSIGY